VVRNKKKTGGEGLLFWVMGIKKSKVDPGLAWRRPRFEWIGVLYSRLAGKDIGRKVGVNSERVIIVAIE
jgi:hypothetical protein